MKPVDHKPRLVMSQTRPWVRRTLFALAAVVFGVIVWLAFDGGRHYAGYISDRYEKEMRAWKAERAHMQEGLSLLRKQTAKLENDLQVERAALTQLRKLLSAQQQRNQELREELQFYRGIVSPKQGRPGLHIHNIKVHEGEGPGVFHYNLTLIHIQGLQKHHRRAKGVVHLSVVGQMRGANKTLDLQQITQPRKKSLPFSFKFFTRFEGTIQLPTGFTPEQLVVKVVPSNRRINGDERKMPWPAV